MNARRAVALALVALGLVTMPATPAAAATRSRGNFFVFDSPNCTGQGNSAQVTVPASVGGVNYPADTAMEIFATDLGTGEQFGPFIVTTDGSGEFCARVDRARATRWRLDLAEPGPGFTDTKIVRVLASPPATTTTEPSGVTPPTTGAPSTSSPATSTSAASTTSTAAVTTTSASTTTTSPTTTTVSGESEPPIQIVPVPPPSVWPSLPGTGSPSTGVAGVAAVAIAAGLGLVLLTRRRATVGR